MPLFSGGGTRLKILEALAAGCAVVSTATGAEGLELTGGVDYLLAGEAQEFLQAIGDLAQNPDLAGRLRQNALETLKKRYDWSNVALHLEKVYFRMQPGETPMHLTGSSGIRHA